jgi:hypothetical protein
MGQKALKLKNEEKGKGSFQEGDAGYGSEENYSPFVKYSYFDKEISDKRPNAFHADNIIYNPSTDTYQALNCQACPMRGPCHKADDNRIIQRSPNLVCYKQKVQVEAVFGNIKQNKGFRRFNLRGIDKATTEIGLITIAHNLQRLTSTKGH